jgi:hypothetical protein
MFIEDVAVSAQRRGLEFLWNQVLLPPQIGIFFKRDLLQGPKGPLVDFG